MKSKKPQQPVLFDLGAVTKKPGSYYSVIRFTDGNCEILPHRTMSDALWHCWQTEEREPLKGSEVRGPRGRLIRVVRGWTGLRWRKKRKPNLRTLLKPSTK